METNQADQEIQRDQADSIPDEPVKHRPYVSLHNHTTYSIMDSLIKPIDLFERAKEIGQEAIAVTDHGTLSGMWDCLKASKKTGVKLIAGCEFYFVDDVANIEDRFRHIVLLAKNAEGYRNLLLMSKEGFDNNIILFKKVYPRIDWKILEKYSSGLICTTACGSGIVSQLINNKKFDEAKSVTQRLKDIFGDDLAVEIQAHAMRRNINLHSDYQDQTFTNNKLIEIANELDIRIIVSTDAHYLNKEDHRAHDVWLAMSSGQPVNSGARLKYNVNDFYLKTSTEIFNKIARNKGEDFAAKVIENTLYFADKCEYPEWIDPKFSNPSGKELPEFPVKDQPDYEDFKIWLSSQEPTNTLKLDALYLRYWCFKELDKLSLTDEERKARIERLDEEFGVLEFHDFSSYMLIVADIMEFAYKNGIKVGPGRGCLAGDTNVLTESGFKRLDLLKVGEKVYTHTGKLRKITNVFEFDVSKEDVLEIKTENSFGSMTLTTDHKVLASAGRIEKISYKNNGRYNKCVFDQQPEWIPAKLLTKKHRVFSSFPERKIKNIQRIDLAKYIQNKKTNLNIIVNNEYIIKNSYCKDKLSISNINKETDLNFELLRKTKLKYNLFNVKQKYLPNRLKFANKLFNYFDSKNITLQDWQDNKDNTVVQNIKRYIEINDDFVYLLGRWVGDGSYKNTNGIVISFNSRDTAGIEKINNIVKNFGFNTLVYKSKKSNAVNIEIVDNIIYNLFANIFCNYQRSSATKHFPSFFRKLNDDLLKSLIQGYFDADGYKNSCKTVSEQLAYELKEALFYLNKQSSVYTTKAGVYSNRSCKTSYHLYHFEKDSIKNGYYSKIKSIESAKINKVYDITVENDHSYLTTNCVVHNSVGGSLVGYLLKIHLADPFKYGLIFARFHNKEKTAFPDIDMDFAPSGRDKIINYVKSKYGDDYVVRVGNVITLTPKPYVKAIARTFLFGGDRKEATALGVKIAETIPDPTYSGIRTITKALEKAPLFAEYAARYPELAEFGHLSGNAVALATHAAGFVIGKRPLPGLVPLRRDKDGDIAIEYEKERVEAHGLVKMDFLGLETLDIITKTRELIIANGKIPPAEPFNYDLLDDKVYDMVSNGDTFCVFQLGESAGTIDLCKKVKPRSIEDLAIINALARPSARDIRKGFIDARHSGKEIELLHPLLQRAFKPTYGFGLFEECLMYLAKDLCAWTMQEADSLRKMTKEKGKYPEKDKKVRKNFIASAVNNGVLEETATKIWDEIVGKFGGYAFNKSLSVFEMIDTYTIEGKYINTKYINEINSGEYVRSRDEITKKDIFVKVIDRHNHGILPLVEIELDTGEKIKCTMNHKFRTKETNQMLPLKQIIEEGLSIVVNTVEKNNII
jgi:DNA polymerase III alpha subunit